MGMGTTCSPLLTLCIQMTNGLKGAYDNEMKT